MLIRKFECYLKDVIKHRRRGVFPSIIRFFLKPLSYCYKIISNARNFFYDLDLMRRYVPPVPLVISIGNIVVGGTGKTPITLMLGRIFSERYRVAILSRGYRSKAEKLDQPIILCEGEGPTFPASYCGDEPFLFAQRLPKVMVIVGRDRKRASLLAANAGVQVILLDDALQHRRLARDFDIIVMDSTDPFGQGHFLPKGFLREDITALKRASLIILNHVTDLERVVETKKKIRLYSEVPIICTKSIVLAVRDLKGQECTFSSETKVGMFCGVAQPDHFRKTVQDLGLEIVYEYLLADHAEIQERKLEQFAQACLKKGAHYLICTEKDRVKLHDFLALSLPVIWVQMDIEIVEGISDWNDFLRQAESII